MKIYTVSDLHLPGSKDKTMDMFGQRWQGHWEKIREDWIKKVKDDDAVLIAGDISWAMQLSEALPDIEAISALPGKKIMIRGNHDFWWSSVTKVREVLDGNTFVLQNDALKIGDFVFAGTRGWTDGDTVQDKKIFRREKMRLELTLKAAAKLKDENSKIIVMLHYPPVQNGIYGEFCPIMEEYGVNICVYGHLHGVDRKEAEETVHNGIRYVLSSCDMIDFTLREII